MILPWRKKLPDHPVHEHFTYDLGYSVMQNGDIITSDGKPRLLSDEHAKIAKANAKKAGKPVLFREPLPHEREDFDAAMTPPPWDAVS